MSDKLIKQSSLYTIGKLFAFLAGLISYPVLTKTLSIEEYGTVALFTVTIGLMGTFIKFGVQQSIIRYKHDLEPALFSSNIIFLSLCTVFATVLFQLMLRSILINFSDNIIFKNPIFFIILFSSTLQALQSYCINLLVAIEKSATVTVMSMTYKILSLSTMLIAILLISATSFSFIIALLLSDLLYFLILIYWILKKRYISGFSIQLIDKKIIKNLLIFGIPMFGYELSNMFHAFVDRFLIEIYLGREPLGLYSASYNMAKMIADLMLGGLITALLPKYLYLWKKSGKAETEKLLSDINKYLILFFPILLMGIYSVSSNLFGVLTTPRYQQYAYLLPIIFSGTFLFNIGIIYSAGLQIKKMSGVMLRVVIESAIINLILNIIFIPKYGIISAAIVTFISYLWTASRFYFLSKPIVFIQFNFSLLIRSSIYALIMFVLINSIYITSDIYTLIVKTLTGSLIAMILIYLFEKDIRNQIKSIIRNRFNLGRNSNDE